MNLNKKQGYIILLGLIIVILLYYKALIVMLTEYENSKDSLPITLECENGDVETYNNISHLKEQIFLCGEISPYKKVTENQNNFSYLNIYKD